MAGHKKRRWVESKNREVGGEAQLINMFKGAGGWL
jgi:hypothetical protein